MEEPDSTVVVLDELAFHPDDLLVIQMGYIVADLVDLFEAISLLICLNQLLIACKLSKVILDGIIWPCLAYRCEEMDVDWYTTPNLRPHTCHH